MKKIFIIGGMGAGKSTATQVLVNEGLPVIDMDKIGHEVLEWETVRDDIREAFGDDVFDENGFIIRSRLAVKAFVSPTETRKLNRITLPRIEDLSRERLDELEAAGHKACVIEYSVFKNREMSIASIADVVIAVLAPLEIRVARAVASGFDEDDVRRRIASQITDAARAEQADQVFHNTSTPEDLANSVAAWWSVYKETL